MQNPEPLRFQSTEDAQSYLGRRMGIVLYVGDDGMVESGLLFKPKRWDTHYFKITRDEPLKVQVVSDSLNWLKSPIIFSRFLCQSNLVNSDPLLIVLPRSLAQTTVRSPSNAVFPSSKFDEEVRSFFVVSENRWYVFDESDAGEVKGGYGISRTAGAIENLVEPVVRSDYDIDQPDSALGPIGARIKAAVKVMTRDDNTLAIGQKRLTEKEIWDRIGPYWNAMIEAPWEDRVDGTFALLKHLCKNLNEVVSFWSKDTHGHFAFRVRAPNREWIKGEVFCPPAAFAPERSPIDADVSVLDSDFLRQGNDRPWHNVAVGPCFIAIEPGYRSH